MSDDAKLGPVARRLAATRRVLCIEDEPDVAGFLRAYFRAAGYDLVHVDPDDVDAVLAALDEHEPDCVLLDVRLRGFSGLEAYRRMRADQRWAFTPVIVVSAHATTDPGFEAPKGLDAFVPKPFNTNALADLVHDRIERADALSRTGTHETLQLLTEEYLRARLVDEIALADASGFAFGLVRVRSLADIVAEVGTEGRDHLLRTLVEGLRTDLPADAVLGVSDGHELAVLVPHLGLRDAYPVLRSALGRAGGEFRFAGGAVVPVVLGGGLAGYPVSADDADGLFMAADSALADAIDADELLTLAR